MSFSTVLVANRGEIACRVIRTARDLGYRTVAVFSDADAAAPHVALADVAVRIGPAAVGDSYLDAERVLDAARRAGADAVHPGYGFLSENAAFARACQAAGLVWVGPPPAAIEAMGDKAAAKARMRAAGVPCVPGFDADDPDDAALLEAAADVGFPLLVKASAGGGGRGMRRVDRAADLPGALRSARAEAAGAFGSGHLLLERLVEGARHVEVQVLADAHGAVLHLGERDCSVQRRHQKVVEEAPSPAVGPDLRARMGAAACAAARAVSYAGAGTVEFLLDRDGAFYFLEMNTRLQVEHPVTEEITGLDLVALQLQVAAGAPLPLRQEAVQLRGHAIEVRLYAEDPADGYAPRTGLLRHFEAPAAEGLRVDAGLSTVSTVSPHYDPMLAKLVAWGPDRETARRRLARALDHTVALGVTTNRAFLARVLRHPVFCAGEATTAFLAAHPDLTESPSLEPAHARTALAAHLLWRQPEGLRTAHLRPQSVDLDLDGERVVVGLLRQRTGWVLDHDGESHPIALHRAGDRRARVTVSGVQREVFVLAEGSATAAQVAGRVVSIRPWDPTPAAAEADRGDGAIRAPSAGRVLELPVAVGDRVTPDTPVARLEAMKLETTLLAEVAGVVREVRAAAGDAVAADQLLLLIEPDPEPTP